MWPQASPSFLNRRPRSKMSHPPYCLLIMGPSLKLLRYVLQHMLPAIDKQAPRRFSNAHLGTSPESSENSDAALYDAWLASRAVTASRGTLLTPGAQRPLSRENVALAVRIAQRSSLDILSLLWQLYPWRVLVLVSMDLFRGVFPVFRGYSQALIINEVSPTFPPPTSYRPKRSRFNP